MFWANEMFPSRRRYKLLKHSRMEWRESLKSTWNIVQSVKAAYIFSLPYMVGWLAACLAVGLAEDEMK
jgi:hypothetical protein